MSGNGTSKTKIEVFSDSLDEAVEVLALAFENDPFIRYIHSHQGTTYLDQVRELFRFVCEARLELRWPLIGTTSNSQLTGVACISVPEKKDWPTSLVEKYEKLKSFIGDESVSHLQRFSNLSHQYAPRQSHHYLAAIGIHPEFQGQGFGRLLLDAVHEMSESHTESTGVYLETAKQENVALYEHFGYHLVSKDKLDDTVDIWYMFRPNNVKN